MDGWMGIDACVLERWLWIDLSVILERVRGCCSDRRNVDQDHARSTRTTTML